MFEGKKLVCPVNHRNNFSNLFSFKKFPIYMGVVKKNFKPEFQDLNFKINKSSGSVQIHPKIPLKKLYFKSHGSGTIGSVWEKHHKNFIKFIMPAFKGQIIEIGGGHNSVSQSLKNIRINKKYMLTSFEPNSNIKSKKNHRLIKDFFSNKYIKSKIGKIDLVIHSHLFEHIYDPNKFLKEINFSLKDKGFHIFTVPNLRIMIKNGYANAMNFEHPYFLEEKMIDYLLKANNFKILKKKKYLNHSIFYKTQKVKKKVKILKYNNFSQNHKIFSKFKKSLLNDIKNINKKILDKNKVYLFGAHIFSQFLLFNGLKSKNLSYIIDNDKKKHFQYLYGTNLKVLSPSILKKDFKPTIILRAAQYNKEIKKQILKINKTAKFI